jgi:hypothetical protein
MKPTKLDLLRKTAGAGEGGGGEKEASPREWDGGEVTQMG